MMRYMRHMRSMVLTLQLEEGKKSVGGMRLGCRCDICASTGT